jgi:hypothetical protein
MKQYLERFIEVIDQIAAHPLPFLKLLDHLLMSIIKLYDTDPFGLLVLGERLASRSVTDGFRLHFQLVKPQPSGIGI